jgi:hypothetical protein
LLARQELDLLVQAATPQRSDNTGGQSMLVTLTKLAVDNPEHAAEILGPWGKAKMAAARETEFIPALAKNVVAILARMPGGNEAAKRALLALPQTKGQIDGYVQAARFRLEGTKSRGLPARAPDSMFQSAPASGSIRPSEDTRSKNRSKS